MAQRTKTFYISVAFSLVAFILLILLALPVSWLTVASDISVYTVFISALVFLVMYTVWSDWWKNSTGWTLVILDLGLMLATAPSVLHLALGLAISQSVFFTRYFIMSISLAAIGVVWRTFIMFKHNLYDKVRKLRNVGKDRKSQAGSTT